MAIFPPPGGARPATPLPLMGLAPPPVGPRVPDPMAIADLRAGITKLMDASQKDRMVAKLINPSIRELIGAQQQLSKPPKASREESEAGGAGPLDQTPEGDVGGTPMPEILARLVGAGAR